MYPKLYAEILRLAKSRSIRVRFARAIVRKSGLRQRAPLPDESAGGTVVLQIPPTIPVRTHYLGDPYDLDPEEL